MCGLERLEFVRGQGTTRIRDAVVPGHGGRGMMHGLEKLSFLGLQCRNLSLQVFHGSSMKMEVPAGVEKRTTQGGSPSSFVRNDKIIVGCSPAVGRWVGSTERKRCRFDCATKIL